MSHVTKDNSLFYTDLAYMSPDLKQKAVWAAQMTYYMKMNSVPLVDAQRLQKYRDADRLIIDKEAYKLLFDPKTAEDTDPQRAQYVSADWEPYPIANHLLNIVRAVIEKLPNILRTKIVDPIAKRQEQKDREKIMYAPMYRRLINAFAEQIGIPKIGDTQDPYAYIENLGNKNFDKLADTIGDPVQQIRNRIQSDDELQMFMQYMYRSGFELAIDTAIRWYLLDLNRYNVKQEKFVSDLMHVNAYAGRIYIDLMTGRPVVKYIDPAHLRTLPFFEINGDDMTGWVVEEVISIAEFERMIGKELTNEQKKKIIDINKLWGATGLGLTDGNYVSDIALNDGWSQLRRTNSQIKIGFASILTQEDTEFAKYFEENFNPQYNTEQPNWNSEDAVPKEDRKVYNVWYNWYYIPLPDGIYSGYQNTNTGLISAESWAWLSNYIFCIHKETDMYREGVDWRYSRSSLVVWRDNARSSFSDIMDKFMGKINYLWHKLQNCLVNDTTGIAFDKAMFTGMLNAIDGANETNPRGGNELLMQMKALRQGGFAWLKFRDGNGNLVEGVDPQKLFVAVDSKHFDKAERYLLMIMTFYNQMTQALAMSDVSQGKQPDPRTPVSGIELAFQSTANARWYIEKPARQMAIMFSERIVRHVWNMAKENKDYKYKKRWEEFKNVVGEANAVTIEAIADMQPENIGVTIVNEYDDQKKEILYQSALQKNAEGRLGVNELGLVLDLDSWRQIIVTMAMAERKMKEEMEAAKQAEHQRQMELMQMQLQIAQANQQIKTQGKVQEIQAAGEVENALSQNQIAGKTQSQMAQKEQMGKLRMEADRNKSELKKAEKLNEEMLKQQAPV